MKVEKTKESVILEILFDAGVKFDKNDFDLYKTIFDNGYYFKTLLMEQTLSKLLRFKEEILEQRKMLTEPRPGIYLKYNNRLGWKIVIYWYNNNIETINT